MSFESKLHHYPNILIVVVDCLRADYCPVQSDSRLRAWPKLVSRGTTFTQMISSASTTPVCFGSLLTGQYSFVHGIQTMLSGKRLNEDVQTLPATLKQLGYSTYAYVTGPLDPCFGLAKGFDVYEHRVRAKTIYTEWGQSFINTFRERHSQEPTFVLLHCFELHTPRVLNGLRAPKNSELEYDLAWRQLDARIEELLEQIEENTIVILTADHGERIRRRSDRFWWGHLYRKLRESLGRPCRPDDFRRHSFHVFEELIHIPCAIAGPGIPEGTVIRDQVRQIDLMPTILDLLDRQPLPPTHGQTLAPVLHGKQLPVEPAYIQSGRSDSLRDWHGLRTEKWKYAERPRDKRDLDCCPMLFDLIADPHERHNVVRKYPEVALRLRHQLDELLHNSQQASKHPGQEMSPEEQERLTEQLRSLGYL
ncbi:MAG: sulfatase-like hydrolase/transferase [Actinobacteria bacterium]|nr:sulfatase-like hydrolase/transferase [Actinomycetota bacterium]